MSKIGEIKKSDFCLENTKVGLQLNHCHGQQGNQFWEFNDETRHLMNNGNCMVVNKTGTNIFMEACNSQNVLQQWLIENLVEDSKCLAESL